MNCEYCKVSRGWISDHYLNLLNYKKYVKTFQKTIKTRISFMIEIHVFCKDSFSPKKCR